MRSALAHKGLINALVYNPPKTMEALECIWTNHHGCGLGQPDSWIKLDCIQLVEERSLELEPIRVNRMIRS